MKVGIYNPYWQILGGAEKYVLFIASCLQNSHQVIIYGANQTLLTKASVKFGMTLKSVTTKSWPYTRLKRNQELKKLDLFFYVTDGSIFWSTARKSMLIIQSPVHVPAKTLANQVKLKSWQQIICYSQFMAAIIKQTWNKSINVLFVPVDIPKRLPSVKKQNIIVSIGRFFAHLHNKKQLEMVKIFKSLIDQGLKGVSFYLVGSIDPGGETYLQKVKEEAMGYPVKIQLDVNYQQLQSLLAKAKIYWHGAGFKEDLQAFPEKAEHFGVATLEAMAHQVVPMAFAAGGQVEIIESGKDGFLWKTPKQLMRLTTKLINHDQLRKQLAKSALEKAKQYSPIKFCIQLDEIIKK